MSTPTIEQRIKAQVWAYRRAYGANEHTHLLTADELRRVLGENEELKKHIADKVCPTCEPLALLHASERHAAELLRKTLQLENAERLARTQLDYARSKRDQWREVARELAYRLGRGKHMRGQTGRAWEVYYYDNAQPALARFDALVKEETK